MSMTDKELSFMARWNGTRGCTQDELDEHAALLKTMAPYIGPMSAASSQALLRMEANRKSGTAYRVANVEQGLWKTGGSVLYDKDHMFLVKASGDVTKVPNTIIPDPVGRKRDGLVPMTVLISSLVRVKGGVLQMLHNPKDFYKRWSKQVQPFDPFRMIEVVETYRRAIGALALWKNIEEDGTTLTNERLVEFIYTSLHDMLPVTYYYLHTFVVFEMLFVFEPQVSKSKKMKYSMLRQKRHGKFAVPETAYEVLKADKVPHAVLKEICDMGYPAVVIFRGGIQPNVKVVPGNDMSAAIQAKTLSLATRGSDKSAMSFMCRNAPYSGLATEEVRTLQRAVAMVGGVVARGIEKIDVEVASVSHVGILYTSLMAHFPTTDWVLAMSNEMQMKSPTTYFSRISTDRRIASHLVRYVPYQMKSHSLKKKEGSEEMIEVALKNYNQDSVRWKPHVEYSGYTLYTTLFGYYPWAVPIDKKGAASTTTSSTTSDRLYTPREAPIRPHYVYKFGQTESFCGIVSTITGLTLWGQDVKVTSRKTTIGDVSDIAYSVVEVPLAQVSTEAEWYRKVIESNAAMESYWMHARRKYCSISNVLRIPKSGVTVVYNSLDEMEIEEQGRYVEAPDESDEAELDQEYVQYENDDLYSSTSTDDSEEGDDGDPVPPEPVFVAPPVEKPRPKEIEEEKEEKPMEKRKRKKRVEREEQEEQVLDFPVDKM